ncbi:MAG: EAL domain-containing protein [Steroidobacteraceae bacterium]
MELSYNSGLVALSIAVAILVSYTALGLAARVAESRGAAGHAWLILGACSMGVGIWSMHFLGMLALSLPIQLRYDVDMTLVSLGVAVLTSGFAIRIASSKQLGLARHLLCSGVMAFGIVGMHYLGMGAIEITPDITYALMPVVASVLIALAASYCALWLTFILRSTVHRYARIARLGAAIIMGCAIAGMHYMGMSAAMIAPGSICDGGLAIENGWLAVAVALAAFGMLTITLITSVFDSHMAARGRAYDESMARADRQLRHQATHDALTGLPNRSQFLQCLKYAIDRVNGGEQAMFAVLFLDLDRFKFVNDSLGHAAGDELLRQIAVCLTFELRTSADHSDPAYDVVSRFGGDEFLVLLNNVASPAEAKRIAEALLAALSSTYDLHGREVDCSASVGIVTSDHCCTLADEVVRNADVAMYEAKRAGRSCVIVFNECMHKEVSRHVLIETCLRRAIGTDELSVVYQPIVELSSGELVSAEALVRWQNPVLGCVSPAEFIPIAEESGLIVALDQWVRLEACRAMRGWRERYPKSAPKTVSVNVSRAELARNQVFRAEIKDLLEKMDLPAHCLQLEVTERDVMRNPEDALLLMQELRAMGVRLAMDDFGTGTSSLGILRTYPFDTIKIDRSFVQGLVGSADVLAVIHATINLVEHLGMASLVEGIEQEAQVSVLLSIGCRYGQGFLFSKPVPADRLVGSIKAKPERRKAEVRETAAMFESAT